MSICLSALQNYFYTFAGKKYLTANIRSDYGSSVVGFDGICIQCPIKSREKTILILRKTLSMYWWKMVGKSVISHDQ